MAKKVLTKAVAPVEMTPGAPERLSKYQTFVPMRVSRSQLRNAPYNPRTIDKHAEKKLRAILKTQGLIEALVWNKRTGNLVGGHQRLAALDALEGSPAYALDVNVIDVDDAEERLRNLTLNNPQIQGQYDPLKMLAMYEDTAFPVDFAKAGFDKMDLEMMFPESEKARSLFAPADMQKSELTRDTAHDLAEIDRMKDEKKKYRERARGDEDTEFYAIVHFENREHRESFMGVRLGLSQDEKYIDARLLETYLDAAERDMKPGKSK